MINNLSDFIVYIKRTCGDDVINVEVSDDQIIQIIEDTIQTYQKYNYGDGTYRDAFVLSLSAGVSAYQLTSAIDSITDIKVVDQNNGINDLFTVQHQLIYPQMMAGTLIGGTGNGLAGPVSRGGAQILADYDISMMYLKDIQDHFAKSFTAQYSSNTNIIRIWPNPEKETVAMIQVWRKEEAEKLYNNYHVKNLAVAKTLQQWGRHIIKYQVTLPGGGTINGQAFVDEGKEKERDTIENIKLESNPPIFFVG